MIRMRRALLFLAIGSLSFMPVTRAAETPPVEADPALFRAVVQLADPNSEVRDDATRTLWKAGRAAEPVLRRAIEIGDPEIAARAREILADFELGIDPDAPPEVVEQLRNYRRANSLEEKKKIIEALAKRGRRVFPALARVYLSEKDERVRTEAFAEVGSQGLEFVPAFLAQGDNGSAERVLEMAVSLDVHDAARAYGIFLALAPKTAESVAAVEKRLGNEDTKESSAAVLAYYHRARGDLAAARRLAEQSGDEELLEHVLLDQRDYKLLAARRVRELDETDVVSVALAACFHRFAGDEKAADRLVDVLKKLGGGGDVQAMEGSRLLLLNGRPAEALAVLEEGDRATTRFELLVAQQRMAEAVKFGEKTLFDQHRHSWTVRPRLARVQFMMGRPEEGTKLLDVMSRAVRQGGEEADAFQLIEAARLAHLDDRAVKEAAAVMKRPDPDVEQTVLMALFTDRHEEARLWLRYFRTKNPGDAAEVALLKVRGIIEGTAGGDEVRRRAQDAAGNRQVLGREAVESRRLLANTLHAADQHAAAAEMWRVVAVESQEPSDYMSVGHALMRARQWKAAAEAYGRAAEVDPTSGAALLLRGQCLLLEGDEKGAAMVERGSLAIGTADAARLAVIEVLKDAGLKKEADAQRQVLLTSAAFDARELVEARRQAALAAQHAGDWAGAAEMWERHLLRSFDAATLEGNEVFYVSVPARLHRARAAAHLVAGRFREGLAEMAACEEFHAADVTMAIDLVPLLAKAGRRAEADALYARMVAENKKLLEKFPQSPWVMNGLAWLQCRLRRDLPEALDYATKASAASPRDTAILDTLAEVQFQLGRKDEAIESIRKCIAIQPQYPRHRMCLERFEKQTPQTEPPPEELE